MPTGTGKTRLFTSIAKDIHKYSVRTQTVHKVLILAHRIELIEQISESVGQKYKLAHGLIIPNTNIDKKYPTQIASVQTLKRRLNTSLKLKFDLIIIDEAHHAVADSYVVICNQFPDAKILGVTATPYRLNGSGFKPMFDDLIISQSISEFIAKGWLSNYIYYSIRPSSKIQQIIDNINDFDIDGDYAERYLNKHFNVDKIRAGIVENYQKYAQGKRGIVYTINIDHNKNVCNAFKKAGINADFIDSKTKPGIRKEKVKMFRNGEIDVLCNVNIFTEGFDCPEVEFIQLTRPTKSLSLYLQQVGRGLRIHNNKSNVLYIDNVGLFNKFGLPCTTRKWKYHFEGRNFIDKEKNISNTVRWIEEKNITEGNEEMMEVFSTAVEITQSYNNEPEISEIEILEDFPVLRETDLLFVNFFVKDSLSSFVDVEYSDEEWEEEIVNFSDYIDSGGNLIKSDDSRYEHDQYKLITKNGKFGILDSFSEEILLDTQYTRIERIDKLNRFIVERERKVGLVDAFTWHFLVNCEYENIELNWNDFFIVTKNEKVGVIKNSRFILPVKYDDVILQNNYVITMKSKNYKIYNLDFKPITIQHDLSIEKHNNIFVYNFDEHSILINNENEVLFPILASKIRITKSHDIPFIFTLNFGMGLPKKYFSLNSEFRIIKEKIFSRIIENSENCFIADNSLIDTNGEIIDNNYIKTKYDNNRHKQVVLETSKGEFLVVDKNQEILLEEFDNVEAAQTYLLNLNKSKTKTKKTIQTKQYGHSQKNQNDNIHNKESALIYKNYNIVFEYNFWVAVKNGDIKTRIVSQTMEMLTKKIDKAYNKNTDSSKLQVKKPFDKKDRLEEVYFGFEIRSNQYCYYAINPKNKVKVQDRDLYSLRLKIKKLITYLTDY